MPYSFPKTQFQAILFKEWRQQRLYLVLGIFFLSIEPLLKLLSTRGESPEIIRLNLEGIDLPGLGFVLLILSVGLAVITLHECQKESGIKMASEPISFHTILLAKFFIGIGILIGSETIVMTWLGIALASWHALGPFMTIFGFWLVSIMVALAFYTVTFAITLLVKPAVFAILIMCAILVAPLFAAEWFISPWIQYLPNGGMNRNIPGWGLQAYSIIQDISPFGIIHYGQSEMTNMPIHFLVHAFEPLIWPVFSLLLIIWIGRHKAIENIQRRSRGIAQPWLQTSLRAFGTLAAAAILQRYSLHLTTTTLLMKGIILLLLWACCHLVARALSDYREIGKFHRTAQLSIVEGDKKG